MIIIGQSCGKVLCQHNQAGPEIKKEDRQYRCGLPREHHGAEKEGGECKFYERGYYNHDRRPAQTHGG